MHGIVSARPRIISDEDWRKLVQLLPLAHPLINVARIVRVTREERAAFEEELGDYIRVPTTGRPRAPDNDVHFGTGRPCEMVFSRISLSFLLMPWCWHS